MLAAMPSGDAGTTWTLSMMRSIALASTKEPTVRQAAVEIIAGLDRSSAPQIDAIRRWLESHIKYVRDPVNIEYVRKPKSMLAEVKETGSTNGDCDDVATMGAALGMVVGLRARFVVCSFAGPRAPFAHVYVELSGPDNPNLWIPLDTTRPAHVTAQPTRMGVYAV